MAGFLEAMPKLSREGAAVSQGHSLSTYYAPSPGFARRAHHGSPQPLEKSRRGTCVADAGSAAMGAGTSEAWEDQGNTPGPDAEA